jgi:LuxR family transcriptional regulator, maltose regulon positive regulatory protein
MYLSIHTVKTHIRHILNKLGVQHRAEAVRMARQLQLL